MQCACVACVLRIARCNEGIFAIETWAQCVGHVSFCQSISPSFFLRRLPANQRQQMKSNMDGCQWQRIFESFEWSEWFECGQQQTAAVEVLRRYRGRSGPSMAVRSARLIDDSIWSQQFMYFVCACRLSSCSSFFLHNSPLWWRERAMELPRSLAMQLQF